MVHECPRYLTKTVRDEQTHTISVPSENLVIPLTVDGVISFFNTRKPTEADKESSRWIDMTYDSPQYDPYDASMKERELRLLGLDFPSANADMFDRKVSKLSSEMAKVSSWLSPTDLLQDLEEHEYLEYSDLTRIESAVRTRVRKGAVSAETLARRWNIGLPTARQTLRVVTQLGVRHFSGQRPTKRMWSKSEALRFRHLNTSMFTDTMQGPCISRRGNKYLQVYTNDAMWTGAYPMKAKSDAPATLDLLFRQVGVPKLLTPDKAMELTQGDFLKKARAAGSHIHPTEPYTPNHQRAETTIHSIKRR